ncbi:MAG: hypothetical protein ACTS41_01945, partial [Candidatus Hodgkinia cicadicola]
TEGTSPTVRMNPQPAEVRTNGRLRWIPPVGEVYMNEVTKWLLVIIIIYLRKRNPMYVRKWNLPPTKTYIGYLNKIQRWTSAAHAEVNY